MQDQGHVEITRVLVAPLEHYDTDVAVLRAYLTNLYDIDIRGMTRLS